MGDTPFEEHGRLLEQHGEERAEKVMKMMLRNYIHLAYINTGREDDQEKHRQYTRVNTKKYKLRYEEIPG